MDAPPSLKAATSAVLIGSMRPISVGCERIVPSMNLFLSAKWEHSKNKSGAAAQHWRSTPVYGIRLAMLSVVIQTHNDEDSLARTLASLVSASVEGVVREVIVCDGGSTDRTHLVADHTGCQFIAGGCRPESARHAAIGCCS